MVLALLKLTELTLRLAIVLAALYLLDTRAAGQFGLLNTLITLYAFMAGFERHGVLQRELVVANEAQTRTAIGFELRFFGLNYALLSPVLICLAYFWLELPPYCALLAAVIAVGEHLSVEIYRLSVIVQPYQGLLVLVVSKNLLLLGGLCAVALSGKLSLEAVIGLWAAVSVIFLIVIALLFRRQTASSPHARAPHFLAYYRASFTHFLIGLVALLAGLIDRIITGAVTDLAVTGIYFRNLMIAACVYNAVTILFHNRTMPRIYETAARGDLGAATRLLKVDFRRISVFYVSIGLAVLAVFTQHAFEVPHEAHLQAEVLLGLLFAFLLRSSADYNNTFLNASHRERMILVAHTTSLLIAASLNLVLASRFGLTGTVIAVVAGSAVLLGISWQTRRRTLRAIGES